MENEMTLSFKELLESVLMIRREERGLQSDCAGKERLDLFEVDIMDTASIQKVLLKDCWK